MWWTPSSRFCVLSGVCMRQRKKKKQKQRDAYERCSIVGRRGRFQQSHCLWRFDLDV